MTYIGKCPIQNAYSSPGIITPNQVVNRKKVYAWPADADPYWANVSLLFQPKATDTSYTTDATGKTITYNGNAALSGLSPFPGGASVALDGNGDFLSFADSADWDFPGDYTWEALVLFANFTNVNSIMGSDSGAGANRQILYTIPTTGELFCYDSYTPSINTGTTKRCVVGSWHYLAQSRASGVSKLYIDGVLGATISHSTSSNAATRFMLGYSGNGTEYTTGNIAAARVTKGVARYTGSTIPLPTGPWPTR